MAPRLLRTEEEGAALQSLKTFLGHGHVIKTPVIQLDREFSQGRTVGAFCCILHGAQSTQDVPSHGLGVSTGN